MLNFLAWRVTFNFLDLGYGAAIANVLFVLMFVLALVYVRDARSQPERRRQGGRGAHERPAPAAPALDLGRALRAGSSSSSSPWARSSGASSRA